MLAAATIGHESQAHGVMEIQGVTVQAGTVIFAAAAGTAPASKPTPSYPDAETRLLSEKLADAQARKLRLQQHGADIARVTQEILDLKRRLREGGQLKPGDALGDGRYLLLDEIGRGGFATVWRAHDKSRDDKVALKVLHSNLAGDRVRLSRFQRGARIMQELVHEAVVRVIEPYGEDGGWHYFVMEHLPGGDLRRAVIESRIRQIDVLPLIMQVCEAVALAHSRRIIHRDIKPANIVLDEHGVPKLTDFDLVGAPDTTGGTRTAAIGTIVYTAPEVLDGSMVASVASDVYSIAMTALFGLHGKDLPMDVLRDPEAAFDGLFVADAVKTELLRALDWDPWRRHRDAEGLRRALVAAMSRAGGVAMVARRDENEHPADEPVYPPLFPGTQHVDDPPPGLLSEVEYRRYYNSRFGFSVDVPTFLVPQPGPANGDGRRFVFHKVVEMTASGIFEWEESATVRSRFREFRDRITASGDAFVVAEAVDSESFSVKIHQGDIYAHNKETLRNGVMSGVSFSYPMDHDPYFDPIARRILASFRPSDR
ncbi:serine/threonine-protein kinase [Sorangium sp. So ce260]|uniref:serine/threonine-protein kinase n=1 Tax=Sorangium sp. So ce260 TaxID=3133291 RepID=UPI003F5E5ED6